MTIKFQGGCFCDIFLTEDELVNRFTGQELWTWGLGNYLGTNDTISRSSPVQTVSGGTDWSFVSGSNYGLIAIKTDGTLWSWGPGSRGRHGNNSTVNQSSPVQTISGGTNWKTAAKGNSVAGGIKTDGTLWIWGACYKGVLGNNTASVSQTIGVSSPIQTIAGGTNWKSISMAADTFHAGGIKTDGTLWVWGANFGKLGDGTGIDQSSPVQTVAGGTNWKMLELGDGGGGAIKTDGTLWTWGGAARGKLGNSVKANTSFSSPVQTSTGGSDWKKISMQGYSAAGALKINGSLWHWGYAGRGYLPSLCGAFFYISCPTQLIGTCQHVWREISQTQGVGSAIRADGTLWLWGTTSQGGRLGNGLAQSGYTLNFSSPVQTLSGGSNWRSIGSGLYAAAVLKVRDF